MADVTDATFDQEVLKSPVPVLVDFWAPWCGPCKMVAPFVDEIAKEYNNKIKVCKTNVDEAPEIATKYAIMSIPTLMIFKNGEVMEKSIGGMDKKSIERFISPYIR